MLLAEIKNGSVVSCKDSAEYRDFCSPPLQEQLDARGFMIVKTDIPYNTQTHKLEPCAPIIEGGYVRVSNVVPKTIEDIELEKVQAMQQIRSQRNQLLLESDWTQIPDAPSGKKAEWAAYRQALRDFPSTIVDPRDSVAWPSVPSTSV
jgi:hypothetical protein